MSASKESVEFGECLGELMDSVGLTEQFLANLLSRDPAEVSSILSGERSVSRPLLNEIMEILKNGQGCDARQALLLVGKWEKAHGRKRDAMKPEDERALRNAVQDESGKDVSSIPLDQLIAEAIRLSPKLINKAWQLVKKWLES